MWGMGNPVCFWSAPAPKKQDCLKSKPRLSVCGPRGQGLNNFCLFYYEYSVVAVIGVEKIHLYYKSDVCLGLI